MPPSMIGAPQMGKGMPNMGKGMHMMNPMMGNAMMGKGMMGKGGGSMPNSQPGSKGGMMPTNLMSTAPGAAMGVLAGARPPMVKEKFLKIFQFSLIFVPKS